MYKLAKGENTISKKIKIAKSMTDRMIGLMFTKNMNGYDALWIKPCNQIHTFFMQFDLDVVFLSKDLKVIKIVKGIKPYRLTWLYLKATSVLEFAAGTLDPSIEEGDQLELVCIN